MDMWVCTMAWREVGLAAATMALLVAGLAPAATADHDVETGTTSTGDVDVYGVGPTTSNPYCAFALALVFHGVTLELHDTTPGDRVLLSAQHHLVPPADAAVATHGDPQATVNVTGSLCDPAIEVAGLAVSGDLGYTLTW